MTIAIDADGVLFDYVRTCAYIVNMILDEDIDVASYETATQFDVLKAWKVDSEPYLSQMVDWVFEQPDVVRTMTPIVGAKEFIDDVRNITDNDFVIVTACPAKWHHEREVALKEVFDIDKEQVHFSRRKKHFGCDALVDDYHGNLKDFSGWRILIDRPWNQDTQGIAVDRAFGYTEALCKINRIVNWNK